MHILLNMSSYSMSTHNRASLDPVCLIVAIIIRGVRYVRTSETMKINHDYSDVTISAIYIKNSEHPGCVSTLMKQRVFLLSCKLKQKTIATFKTFQGFIQHYLTQLHIENTIMCKCVLCAHTVCAPAHWNRDPSGNVSRFRRHLMGVNFSDAHISPVSLSQTNHFALTEID